MMSEFFPFAVGALASFILGSLWYSPVMFGTQWQKLTKIKTGGKKPSMSSMTPLFIVSLLTALLMSYVLGSLLIVLRVNSPLIGMQVGFLVWFGFVGTTSLLNTMYGKEPLKLYLIDNGYHLVSLMLMGFFYVLLSR